MYEPLTKYLPDVASDKSGEWTEKGPCISYGPKIRELEQSVYDFVNSYMEVDLTKYGDILAEHNIDWNTASMSGADATNLNGNVVMALLVAAVRAERFSDGAILRFLENGSIERWLRRLAKIDDTVPMRKRLAEAEDRIAVKLENLGWTVIRGKGTYGFDLELHYNGEIYGYVDVRASTYKKVNRKILQSYVDKLLYLLNTVRPILFIQANNYIYDIYLRGQYYTTTTVAPLPEDIPILLEVGDKE